MNNPVHQFPELDQPEFWMNSSNQEILNKVQQLPDINASLVATETMTPLLRAIAMELDPDLIAGLLQLGADPTIPNRNGNTALHWYVQRQAAEPRIISLLVQHGADPNGRNPRGNTPLHNAYRDAAPDTTIATLISEGASPFATNHDGQTPEELRQWQQSAQAPPGMQPGKLQSSSFQQVPTAIAFYPRLLSVRGVILSDQFRDPEPGFVKIVWSDQNHLSERDNSTRTSVPQYVTVNSREFPNVCARLKMTEPSSWYPLRAIYSNFNPAVLVIEKDMDALPDEFMLLDHGLGEPASITLKLTPEDNQSLAHRHMNA